MLDARVGSAAAALLGVDAAAALLEALEVHLRVALGLVELLPALGQFFERHVLEAALGKPARAGRRRRA